MDEPSELSCPCKGSGGISGISEMNNSLQHLLHSVALWCFTSCKDLSPLSHPAGRHLPYSSQEPIPGVCAVSRQGSRCKSGKSQEEVICCSGAAGVHLSVTDHTLAATRCFRSVCDILHEPRWSYVRAITQALSRQSNA